MLHSRGITCLWRKTTVINYYNKIFLSDLFHFGVPGLPYSMMLLIWEEFRKYLIRNVKPSGKSKTNWFERYSLW
jgi:hypothetical protein